MQRPKVTKLKDNQYIIETPTHKYLQSYNSLIAEVDNCTGQVRLDKHTWDYSATTGKYRNEFLGEGINETRQKIKSGEYQLVELN